MQIKLGWVGFLFMNCRGYKWLGIDRASCPGAFLVRAASGVFPGQEVSSGEPLRLFGFFFDSGCGGERSSRPTGGSEPEGEAKHTS